MFDESPVLMLTKIYKNFLNTKNYRLEKYNLTQQQLVFMLIILENEKGISLTELTQILGIDKSNTTRTVQNLEKMNYVTRETTKSKDKKYIIHLTKEGLKAAKEIKNNESQRVTEFLSILTGEEQILLGEIIKKLTDNL